MVSESLFSASDDSGHSKPPDGLLLTILVAEKMPRVNPLTTLPRPPPRRLRGKLQPKSPTPDNCAQADYANSCG